MNRELLDQRIDQINRYFQIPRRLFYGILNKIGVSKSLVAKVQAFESIPGVAFQELLFKLGMKEDPDREVIAYHEGGHALAAFLIDEKSVLSITLRNTHSSTQKVIRQLLGEKYDEPGEVDIDGMMDESDITNVFLAGIAATSTIADYKNSQYHSGEEQIVDKMDTGTQWNDITEPCRLIAEEWEKLYGKAPSSEDLKKVYLAWLKKLTSLMGTKKFQSALKVMQGLALKPTPTKKAHEIIKEELSNAGFSEQDIAEMRDQIRAINLNSIISSLEY